TVAPVRIAGVKTPTRRFFHSNRPQYQWKSRRRAKLRVPGTKTRRAPCPPRPRMNHVISESIRWRVRPESKRLTLGSLPGALLLSSEHSQNLGPPVRFQPPQFTIRIGTGHK